MIRFSPAPEAAGAESGPSHGDITCDQAMPGGEEQAGGQGLLVAIASNPPLTTSGERTRGRLDQARAVLGFAEVRLVNLFAVPTYRTGGVGVVGRTPEGWHGARDVITEALDQGEAVLLAYGVTAPSGPAREHHRQQVDWLEAELRRRQLPVYWVGGAPRHPSRWQRYTFRHHPDLPYADGLKLALTVR
jgi:hypothetical protein